jgi:hypothetical protein
MTPRARLRRTWHCHGGTMTSSVCGPRRSELVQLDGVGHQSEPGRSWPLKSPMKSLVGLSLFSSLGVLLRFFESRQVRIPDTHLAFSLARASVHPRGFVKDSCSIAQLLNSSIAAAEIGGPASALPFRLGTAPRLGRLSHGLAPADIPHQFAVECAPILPLDRSTVAAAL